MTTAVRLPAVGFVEKVTVSDVAVDAVTVPTAPLLKTTVLLPGVVLKPEPLIVIVAALAARAAVLAVTGRRNRRYLHRRAAACAAGGYRGRQVAGGGGCGEGHGKRSRRRRCYRADCAGPLKVTVLPDAVGLKP